MIVFFFNFNKQSKQPLSSDFWPLRQQNNPFYQTKQVLQKTILLYNSIATNKSTFLALDNELFVRWGSHWPVMNTQQPRPPLYPEQHATTKWNNGTISRNLLQCFFQTSFIFNPYRRRPAISSNAEHQRRTASAEWKTTTRLVLARFRAHQVALTLLFLKK